MSKSDSTKLLQVTLASLFGTMLEFYDHFIYGTAAAGIFPTVFFAGLDKDLALLLSLAVYGIAFVSRPLGALLFGHFGDRIGRRTILIVVLVLMGTATFLIGCLPSFETAGMFGACALVFLRLMQGIALGGEWGGAALMVNEYCRGTRYQGLLGSIVQIASPLGFLFASGVFAIVTYVSTPEELMSITWRYPFFASIVLVGLGVFIRSRIDESPEFENLKANKDLSDHQPVLIVFRHHWKNLLLAIGTRIGSDAAFYVFALFPLVFLPAIGVDKQVAINAGIVASIGQASGIPLFGWLCDKWGTRKVLLLGSIINIAWLLIFFPMLSTASSGVIYFAAFGALFCLAAMWAPLAAHLPKMFPVEVRFTGAGVGFQAAGILGGAIAPTICVSLFSAWQSTVPVVVYLTILLLLAYVCVYTTKTE
jgi:MFS family permease